jgi:type I restriction-modification system DNA methylase subunit
MERFGFDEQIARMSEKNLLYEVIKAFAKIDLSSAHIDNVQMGYVFEELIRIGAEQANEEAGEHFTPREVIKLMVNLLLSPEKDLTHSHVVKTIYDPACGTGGMLSVSEKYIREPAVREVSARNSKTHRRDDDSAHERERQDRDALYGRCGVSELGVSNTCQGNSEFD